MPIIEGFIDWMMGAFLIEIEFHFHLYFFIMKHIWFDSGVVYTARDS